MNPVQKIKINLAAGYHLLRERRRLKIGPRLLASFLTIILLTGLIGFLAVHQLRNLTATTHDLNTRDLPEVITIEHLRSLLYRERDLERRLVSGNDPNMTADLATLTSTLDEISRDRSTLMSLGSPDAVTQINAYLLFQQFTGGLVQSSANSKQMLTFVKSNKFSEAQSFMQNSQGPLLQTLFNATAQLRTTEQVEVTSAAAKAQQQSNRLTWMILGLTLFSLPLSVVLALLITRSLTQPLTALLNATQAMTDGDLEVDLHVAPGDELGQLAATFNGMRLKLRSTIAKLALERQQTQAIIEASADGVMLVDVQRKILQFNPAAERLSGWTADKAIGRYCWEVLGCHGTTPEQAEEHERSCPLRLALETNSEHLFSEMHVETHNGQQRWYALSSAPIPMANGPTETPRLVVGIHDITQLKAVEQLKSDFVAMVSHELRAPLTTVTASVETLELLDPIGEQESFHEVVGILSQQTGRLRQVVEEVLQIARVDAGRLQVDLQPLGIVQFLVELLEDVRESWIGMDRPLSLTAAETNPVVWADRAALEIVVRNLLNNAQKYTPPGTPIEVTVKTSHDSDRVLISVTDHGAGIPPGQLNSIFQSFSRGVRSSHNWTRGYGLGLYIAREILRVHNGDIWAENRPGGGASFTFTLCTVNENDRQALEVETEGFAIDDYYDTDD